MLNELRRAPRWSPAPRGGIKKSKFGGFSVRFRFGRAGHESSIQLTLHRETFEAASRARETIAGAIAAARPDRSARIAAGRVAINALRKAAGKQVASFYGTKGVFETLRGFGVGQRQLQSPSWLESGGP